MVDSTEDILNKYGNKIEAKINNFNGQNSSQGFSQSYESFKKAMSPEFSRYEKFCKSLGKTFKIKVSEKDKLELQKDIDSAHINVTPEEVMGLSIVALVLGIFIGLMFFVITFILSESVPITFLLVILGFSLFLFSFLLKTPRRLALKWRLKASSQMVPAILYIVIYMRHTSNLEKAISFAAENLEEPLALDFRKIFWDVEVKKYSTIKESLDSYLETWREHSLEFIEAIHLIESSLYEPQEERRIEILERSLQVILDGVYDKMLKYTHEVKSPLTSIYMLGIVLPTLALAILPLASTLMGGAIKITQIFIIFNIIIPFFVYYMTYNAMFKRPGGYGDSSALSANPLYLEYTNKKHLRKAITSSIPLILIGLLPIIWMYIPLYQVLGVPIDITFGELGLNFMESTSILGIVPKSGGGFSGPNGPLSIILSLFLPLGIAMIFIKSYKNRTKEILKEKERYSEVESEFNSSLFQLGNRIGDGSPAELAFGKVAESSKGTSTEGFFKIVNDNIQKFGMNLESALFDAKRGAVVFYPSHMIITSMKILAQSVKKGLKIAARSLMSISEYVKNIKKVSERLNDLLADIVSDMKSNMTFLAPLLSGIIVGLSGMIALILGNLANIMSRMESGEGLTSIGGGITGMLESLNPEALLSTYWIQVIVGVYLIEIVFILTTTLVTIKNGKDDLLKTAETGKNLKRTIVLYSIVALVSIIVLTMIGAVALSGLGT